MIQSKKDLIATAKETKSFEEGLFEVLIDVRDALVDISDTLRNNSSDGQWNVCS